ncbi:transcriptional regulator, ArsR family [Geomicrobium sp. JCM 19037]|uniref:autorepressor SdpR family transcription factor n=1 Tax=Geomicrobium sp. JCM 19037 TaxID=1460634 RepID=UPI00045F3F72|nr:autorepressor SdpR family transcription factor [Geomicrobium sp. JCM 19037]GAK03781.1 transcriptional regulator, ArsR family [Geomicrobium sp. JCM 19037]
MNPTAVFKALADDTRRQMIEMLRERNHSAGEFAAVFNMSKPSITNHLNILHGANLVYREKKGQYVIYSLNMTLLQEAMLWLQKMSKGDEQ